MGQHTYTPPTNAKEPVSQIRQSLRKLAPNPTPVAAQKAKLGLFKKAKKKTVQQPEQLAVPAAAVEKTVEPIVDPKPVKTRKQKPARKVKPVKAKKVRASKPAPAARSEKKSKERRQTERRRDGAGSLHTKKTSTSELAVNKYLRRGYVTVFSLVFIFGGWTVLAKIQGAVVASGQVAVDGDPKILQHLEGGIISEIAVKEGDFVSQGQTVLKLDAIILEANLDAAETNYFENQALIDRLISEQNGYERIQWSRELIKRRSNRRVQLAVSGQEQLFDARRYAITGQIEQLSQRLEQLRGEDNGLISEIDFTQSELNLVDQEHLRMAELLRQNLVSRNRVTQLELDSTRLRNSVAKLTSRRASVRSLIEETQIEIAQVGRLRDEQILTELRIAQTQADSFSQTLKTVSKKAKHVQISAPVSGVVHEMTATTIGGVIAPGQEIMQIIPQRDALIINAQIQPQDIDQVRIGQETNVIFSALKQSAAPELDGIVSYISADNLIDPVTGSPYFDVEISIDDSQLPKLQGQALIPGMPADIFVQTKERTVFEYLTGPLKDTFRKTMRDG